jgi:hypothetical protein
VLEEWRVDRARQHVDDIATARFPSVDDTLMMVPEPAACMCGRTAFIPCIGPSRLTSMTRRTSSMSICSTVPYVLTDALLTQVSMRPNRVTAACASSTTWR